MLSIENILIILVVGGIAGWLAGIVIRGAGLGVVVNILLGIVGGFVGTWVLNEMRASMPGGPFVSTVLTAFVGAALLLLVAMVLSRSFVVRRR